MATDFSSKKVSEIYAEGLPAEELSLRPVNLKVIGNVNYKKILDLGCGNGRYSIIFAKKGAKVIGVDVSKYQLEIAHKINSHPNIKYMQGDVSTLPNIKSDSMDIVFMNLLIPDLDNIKKLPKVFSETTRVLRTKGRFIFSILHPLYLSPQQDTWDKAVNFKKKNYFKEGSIYKAEAITKKGNKMKFKETHFSLGFISKLLNANKFMIKRIIESKAVPNKGIYLPKYLIIECIICDK